jgi:hypothetical protein
MGTSSLQNPALHAKMPRTVNENILKNWVPPPPNVKLFTWLATRGTLWTEDRRRRHNLDAHDVCWMCDQEQETRDHILVNCSYTGNKSGGAHYYDWAELALSRLNLAPCIAGLVVPSEATTITKGVETALHTLFMLTILALVE